AAARLRRLLRGARPARPDRRDGRGLARLALLAPAHPASAARARGLPAAAQRHRRRGEVRHGTPRAALRDRGRLERDVARRRYISQRSHRERRGDLGHPGLPGLHPPGPALAVRPVRGDLARRGMATVYLGTHWLSDVLLGWVAGLLILLALPWFEPMIARAEARILGLRD